jgi:hypothetical protein
MSGMRNPRSGFGLTELVVASAAAAMMFALLAPALNKGQAGVDVRRCQDNLRRLARGHFMYVANFGGFSPMSYAWPGVVQPQPGRGGWYDNHGWYSLVGPFIGEPAWAATLDLTVSLFHDNNTAARRGGLRLKIHACPADIGLQRNEWSLVWASVRSNYVVNAGNTDYGQATIGNVPFLGAPFAGGLKTSLATIADGLSYTLLMSEVVVFPETAVWGGAYSGVQTSLGGQVFTGYNPPNSNTPDVMGRGRFGGLSQAEASRLFTQQGIPVPLQAPSSDARASYIAPRSKHPGGFNTVMCNGATGFITNDIDLAVWRALSTARGAEGL